MKKRKEKKRGKQLTLLWKEKKNAIDDHGKAQQKADIRYVIMYPNCPSFEVACSVVISFEVACSLVISFEVGPCSLTVR